MSVLGNPRTDWDHRQGECDWFTSTQNPGELGDSAISRAKACGELYSTIQHSSRPDNEDKENDKSLVMRCTKLKLVSGNEFSRISSYVQETYGKFPAGLIEPTTTNDTKLDTSSEEVRSKDEIAPGIESMIESERPRLGHVRDKVSKYESISPTSSSGAKRPPWSRMFTTPTCTEATESGRKTPSDSLSRGTGNVPANHKGIRRAATYTG